MRVSRVLARNFDGRSETSLDPDLRVFVSDLTRPYGVPLREDLLRAGVGHSYGEMAEGLLAQALPNGEPVDLLLLAFAIPDVRPGRSTAVHLTRFCAGTPLAFAVNDQGPAAAFTALRIVQDYQRTGGCRRAVVLVAEQASLHYTPAVPVRVPDVHCAVALVCEESATPELTVHQETTKAGSVAQAVAGRLAALGPEAVLLAGSGLDGIVDPDLPTVLAPAGQPTTGVWSQLATRLPGWREQRRPVLVADYDPALGRLSLVGVQPVPAAATAGRTPVGVVAGR
ncbi:2-hydroxy-acid oxidase [Streptacidiphilus sp. P02-A3a]|uniref:2-hydroxy-acid oxidase n=1 Tax=Streptacidiphilus sp. P02-A3a TaxID=2704468 RepID=UPI0015FB9A51|nr:2-hydroxy-acid oxidase [Streptacidiphilus sp. P02-A3a]QMU69451.1 2-hydroxy-acid oxidase [Streptacidiphilus sp. P02-A3a]